MKILSFTSLYPNIEQPSHGVFVENRLRRLFQREEVEGSVVAPVPWFPIDAGLFGEYARYVRIPDMEQRNGISIQHPRYLTIPKVGMTVAPYLMARSVFPTIKRMVATGHDFDLLDAHYFYPDGVAAAMIARKLNKKLVITARGTDLNLIPKYTLPRKQILWAANQASAIITVCGALKDVLMDMGIEDRKVKVLRNGVDLEVFSPPSNRNELRQKLGMKQVSLLSVGLLIERKGHHLVVEALQDLPDVHLYIAGSGPEEKRLKNLAINKNVDKRVTFLGNIPHEKLKEYYGASDIMILASSREGWANVLLESMACGTPVVATDIWGTPEVVQSPESGLLIEERNADAISEGVKKLLANYPERKLTRHYAERFSWDETTQGQIDLFSRIIQ